MKRTFICLSCLAHDAAPCSWIDDIVINHFHHQFSFIQIECKSRPWLIEPTTGKYLFVSLRGFYLSRYDPQVPLPINQTLDVEEPNCPTKSRVIITTGESKRLNYLSDRKITKLLYSAGVTVTACPLSSDYSDRHSIKVFSAGWYHKSAFQRHEASPALSIEFLPDMYDFNEYTVTWLELSRMPPIAEGIGKSIHLCNLADPSLCCLNLQKIVSTRARSLGLVLMHRSGAMAKFTALREKTSRSSIVRGSCGCQPRF